MTLRTFLSVCVVLCITKNTFADTEKKKCTKMDGRTTSQITTLRQELLCNYDRHAAPVNSSLGNRVPVEVYFGRYRINYKSSPGWSGTNMYTMVTWTDHRLKWNQSEHNNRTQITFARSETWSPDIEGFPAEKVVVAESGGSITSFGWIQMIGNCWPIHSIWGDQRECVLSFRVDPEDKVQLVQKNIEDIHWSKSASWSVVKGKRIFPQRKGEKNDKFVEINKRMPWKYGPGYFESKVTIQRNFAIQDAVIFSPATVVLVLLVSSTCIPATQGARVAMLSTIIIVQVYMFHQACRAMPFLPGKVANIVALYHDTILCSGAAVVEWLIAYIIATQREFTAENTGESALPKDSVFSALKTILIVSEKDLKSIKSQLLDRITFLLLTIGCFILLVVEGRRPPSIPLYSGESHDV